MNLFNFVTLFQEFLKAQELKEQILAAEKEKEEMTALLESADVDALKRFSTPKSTSSSATKPEEAAAR
jgi:hypothetical protein